MTTNENERDKNTVLVDGKLIGKFKETSRRALANRLTDDPEVKKKILEGTKTIWDVLQRGAENGVVYNYNILRDTTGERTEEPKIPKKLKDEYQKIYDDNYEVFDLLRKMDEDKLEPSLYAFSYWDNDPTKALTISRGGYTPYNGRHLMRDVTVVLLHHMKKTKWTLGKIVCVSGYGETISIFCEHLGNIRLAFNRTDAINWTEEVFEFPDDEPPMEFDWTRYSREIM